MKRNRRWGAFLASFAGCALMLVFLYLSVASVAYNADWYAETQDRLGVFQEERDEMNREIAAYLAGENAELSQRFNMQERLHMKDVLGLFEGGKKITAGAGIAAMASLIIAFFLMRPSRTLFAMAAGCGVFLLLLLLLGLWAAFDFDHWFTTLHRWVFTNDLWLFDPAQSRMIRILPLEFFVAAVLEIALRFLGLATVCAGAGLVMGKGLKKHDL